MPDHELSPAARHVLTALTSTPITPTEVDVDLLAALLDGPAVSAELVLDEFFRTKAVMEIRPGRYDIRGPRPATVRPVDQDARVLVEWLVRLAVRADRTTRPYSPRLSPLYNLPGRPLVEGTTYAAEWADLNRASLLSALNATVELDWLDLAVPLAEALWGLTGWTGYHQAQVTVAELGLAALVRLHWEPYILGDEEHRERTHLVQMSVFNSRLAIARTNNGNHKIARHHATVALELAEQSGEPTAVATALGTRGRAILADGDPAGALVDLHQAAELDQADGDDRGIAVRRHLIGTALSGLGLRLEALVDLRKAAEILTTIGDQVGRARVLTTIGAVQVADGRPEHAFGPLREALDVMTHRGSTAYLADVFAELARAARAVGANSAARNYFRAASRCYRSTRLDLQADLVDAELHATP